MLGTLENLDEPRAGSHLEVQRFAPGRSLSVGMQLALADPERSDPKHQLLTSVSGSQEDTLGEHVGSSRGVKL